MSTYFDAAAAAPVDRLPELPVGGLLRVQADDPAAAVDIPVWCRMRGQEYVGAVADGYDVRRTA